MVSEGPCCPSCGARVSGADGAAPHECASVPRKARKIRFEHAEGKARCAVFFRSITLVTSLKQSIGRRRLLLRRVTRVFSRRRSAR